MNMNANSVKDLLVAEGFGPRLSFAGFAAAVWLAEVVGQTIASPVRRAEFVAAAAADLLTLDYQPLEGLEDEIGAIAERAEAERPTPAGSVELWGGLMQRVAPA